MDKFRDFLRTLKRIHFWILCPLTVVLGFVGWFLAVSDLNKQKEANLRKIEGTFSTVQTIRNKDTHPNEKVAEAMDQLIAQRRKEIEQAWSEKWQQQTGENSVLTWPEELAKKLGPGFVKKVESMRPIEKEVPFPLPENDEHQLRLLYREAYRDYIKSELPKLAEMISATWSVQSGMGSGRGWQREEGPMFRGLGQLGSGQSLATQSVVHWNPTNQQEIQQKHFDWSSSGFGGGRGGPEGFQVGPAASQTDVPDTLQILYAQEDLWVLRSLMNIIQRSNAGAQTRFSAAIKEIEFIKIGKDAVPSLGQITPVTAAEEAPGMMGPGGPMEMGGPIGMGPPMGAEMGSMREGPPSMSPDRMAMMEGGGEYGMSGMAGMPGMRMAVGPAEGRYVDKDYEPLPAQKLREVMSAENALVPEDAYLAVAKRVPVRMRLKIDQRKLNRLLVECANSNLTVEVRQLRINPEDKMFPGGGMEMGNMFRGPESFYTEGGPPRGRPGLGLDLESGPQFPFDITVELYGIVYLYNPVDKRALGIEDEALEGAATPDDAVAAAR